MQVSAVHGLSHDLCGLIQKKRKPGMKPGFELVAGTGFGTDLMHTTIITARWIYVPAKQEARRIERVGMCE